MAFSLKHFIITTPTGEVITTVIYSLPFEPLLNERFEEIPQPTEIISQLNNIIFPLNQLIFNYLSNCITIGNTCKTSTFRKKTSYTCCIYNAIIIGFLYKYFILDNSNKFFFLLNKQKLFTKANNFFYFLSLYQNPPICYMQLNYHYCSPEHRITLEIVQSLPNLLPNETCIVYMGDDENILHCFLCIISGDFVIVVDTWAAIRGIWIRAYLITEFNTIISRIQNNDNQQLLINYLCRYYKETYTYVNVKFYFLPFSHPSFIDAYSAANRDNTLKYGGKSKKRIKYKKSKKSKKSKK